MISPLPSSLPPHGPYTDDLAEVVVRRLEKRPACRSWGLLKTLVLGVPSFGILPLLAWPARFRDYVADESHALQELAQWAKLRGRQPAAVGPLLAAAEETTISPLSFVLALVLSALVVGMFAIEFTHVPFTLDRLLDSTYSQNFRFTATSRIPRYELIYRVWVIALTVGYGVQFIHIRTHAADVQQFVERFNPVAQAEMLPPVRFPMRGWAYFRPMWILTAVILAMYGAWWGIPMVLAGMSQRRYTGITGRRIRHELAKRVKDIVMFRQLPAATAPVIARRCENPRCLAPVRPQARFCARCGSAMSEGKPS
jgi:hypothetical protein